MIECSPNQKINILGTEYEIETVDSYKIGDNAGACEFFNKKILIRPNGYFDSNEDKQRVYRHEIIHAFFHESGLLSFASDEILCDFLASQFLKLNQLFTDLNIL